MRKQSKFAQSEDVSLQITSMADVFVILLVFLLKSLTSGLSISMSQAVTLPMSKAILNQAEQALKVEITKEGIFVEGEEAMKFVNRKPASGELILPELKKSLTAAREKRVWMAKQGAAIANEKEVLVIADKGVPYGTIKKVLATVTMEGFTDAKLAVAHE